MSESVFLYLGGLPQFAAYFVSAVVLTLLYAVIYARITPHHEWSLIKQNCPAAAVAFGGSLLGFVLPLASAIENSVNLLDCVLWGVVALLVQIGTFYFIRLFMPKISERIANNEMAAGVWVAAASVAAGLLNAASMTY